MNALKKLLLMLFGLSLVGTAYADGLRPMIEVGAGEHTGWLSGTNVLLRVGFGLRKTTSTPQPGDITSPEQIVLAHITGNLAVTPANGQQLPFVDIEFIPLSDTLSVLNDNGNSMTGDIRLLPMALGRDINLDEQLTIKVSVVGVQFGMVSQKSEHVALFAQIAADALGYKMASHVSNLSTFNGMHIVGLGGELGAAFIINDNFTIRAAMGVKADLNWWGTRFQSDMKAYAEIRADLYKFIQVFVQASLNGNWDSGPGFFRGGPELMAGVTFLF